MKKLLVTGATGYIGHAIARKAAEHNYKVSALVRDPLSPNAPHHPNITLVTGDITDKRAVARCLLGCDYLIHAAGLTRLYSRQRDLFYTINVEGTRNVVECAMAQKIKRMVYTSSCALAGPSFLHPLCESDPRITPLENDYEISKFLAEKMVKEAVEQGLDAVIVSPSRVYGPGLLTSGNPITSFILQCLKRGFAFVPRSAARGNYVFIDDVVNGHLLALCNGQAGEKYYLGGENLTYGEFFAAIKNTTAGKPRIIQAPHMLLKMYASAVSIFNLIARAETHLSRKVVDRLLQNRTISSGKAMRELGYCITPLDQGIASTINFLKSQNHL